MQEVVVNAFYGVPSKRCRKRWPHLKYVVYSGDLDASKEHILLKAKQRFGVEIDPKNVHFIFLRFRRIVEADMYPRFTLVLQTIAGFFLGCEALFRLNPHIFIDSMGYPFTLPLFKYVAGSHVLAYVHYPTISCDMIDLVEKREWTYNNAEIIASSPVLSQLKLWYYRAFSFVYRLAGNSAEHVMVNGSWTKGHIDRMWKCQSDVIFPPCDVKSFLELESVSEEILSSENEFRILSIGQIRPEKNHSMQLDILKRFSDLMKKENNLKVLLTIAGGCRNEEDRARVKDLQLMATKLGINEQVKWKLNVSFEELLQLLSESLVSIHTMRNEHFGISVVEGMASGTIMVAHDSGGPKMDIVKGVEEGENRTGFLANTTDEFAEALCTIASMSAERRNELRRSARQASKRFTEEQFSDAWLTAMTPFIASL